MQQTCKTTAAQAPIATSHGCKPPSLHGTPHTCSASVSSASPSPLAPKSLFTSYLTDGKGSGESPSAGRGQEDSGHCSGTGPNFVRRAAAQAAAQRIARIGVIGARYLDSQRNSSRLTVPAAGARRAAASGGGSAAPPPPARPPVLQRSCTRCCIEGLGGVAKHLQPGRMSNRNQCPRPANRTDLPAAPAAAGWPGDSWRVVIGGAEGLRREGRARVLPTPRLARS